MNDFIILTYAHNDSKKIVCRISDINLVEVDEDITLVHRIKDGRELKTLQVKESVSDVYEMILKAGDQGRNDLGKGGAGK